jgi:hypothetical protein
MPGSPSAAATATLWAITCHFNPAGYRRRLRNYRAFRRQLAVPLISVELSFTGDYELTLADADILIQVHTSDVMWQKERLLNLALDALPPACRFVAWLDADVIFDRDDWFIAAMRELERRPVVQPFALILQCVPDAETASLERESTTPVTSSLASRAAAERARSLFSLQGLQAAGIGWTARREILDTHGFYDACIIGGGDRAFAAAALGDLDGPARAWCWNPRQVRHYRDWAEPLYRDVQGDVGFVEGRIYHLWHGDARHRRYRDRLLELAQYDFDPRADIRLGPSGCWQWATAKHEMHQYLVRYFDGRREDEQDVSSIPAT